MGKPVKRIAIIGAGATGLVQLKNLLDVFSRPGVGHDLDVVVFEIKSEVGGVWFSDEKEKHYRRAVLREKGKGKETDHERMYFYPPDQENPSPMYEGLRTNLPNELMAFRDFPFPEGTPVFPDRRVVQKYLEDYADHFDLRRRIRFNTSVERLYQAWTDTGSSWFIESIDTEGESAKEEFDNVCVANGHYSDSWIPDIPGLSSFKGEIMHSRYYLCPDDYAGRTVLVVGSYASGSDIARQIASLNIGAYDPHGRPTTPQSDSSDHRSFTKVYVSSSPGPSPTTGEDSTTPWTRYITYRPLISHVDQEGQINFQDDADPIRDVDIVIFATGYNFSLPFCKTSDQPWNGLQILDGQIQSGERDGGSVSEVGGMKGLGVEKLDPLLLFLENDPSRSIAFPLLPYLIVPFLLAETQTRLIAMLWSSILPPLPDDTQPPPNPSNPYFTPAPTPPLHEPRPEKPPARKVIQMRKKLVFGAPYEFEYQEYLMSLMESSDDPEWVRRWWESEPIKKRWREDTGLRKRTLGY